MSQIELSDLSPDEPRKLVQVRVGMMIGIVIDAIFLVGWVWVTWCLNIALENLELSNLLDTLSLRVIQVVLGVATIVPLGCYTVIDMWKLLVRTYMTLLIVWEKREDYRKVGNYRRRQ